MKVLFVHMIKQVFHAVFISKIFYDIFAEIDIGLDSPNSLIGSLIQYSWQNFMERVGGYNSPLFLIFLISLFNLLNFSISLPIKKESDL